MMHNFTVNASLQIIPLVQDRHAYDWVDEAIEIIQATGIKYEVGPFATVLEGTYEEVFGVIHRVNEHLRERGCAEWIANIQIQVRSDADMTGDEKITRFKKAD